MCICSITSGGWLESLGLRFGDITQNQACSGVNLWNTGGGILGGGKKT